MTLKEAKRYLADIEAGNWKCMDAVGSGPWVDTTDKWADYCRQVIESHSQDSGAEKK